MEFVRKVARDQKGAGMTEYAILVVLIALVVLFAVNRFGRQLFNTTEAMTETVGNRVVAEDAGPVGGPGF